MKPIVVALMVASCISVAATAVLPVADAHRDQAEGRLLLQHDVSMYAAERGALDGAPGASAIGFRVSNAVQGGALIVGLDQPVLGVFVGLDTPNDFMNAPYQDLHVNFTLVDGSTRSVNAAGGCGTAMLFQSPADVPMSNLRTVALYVDDAAGWAK